MESITLGQIATVLTFLGTLIGSISYLFKNLKKWLKTTIKEELEPINKKLDNLSKNDKSLELNADKNFLVEFIKNVENGNVNVEEKERFYEISKRYHELGGNGYIEHRIKELEKEGKL